MAGRDALRRVFCVVSASNHCDPVKYCRKPISPSSSDASFFAVSGMGDKKPGVQDGHFDGEGFGSNMKFGVSLKIFLTASNVDVSRSETQSIGMVASWGPSKIAR